MSLRAKRSNPGIQRIIAEYGDEAISEITTPLRSLRDSRQNSGFTTGSCGTLVMTWEALDNTGRV